MTNKLKRWELVAEKRTTLDAHGAHYSDITERMRVVGGWLYRTRVTFTKTTLSVALTFVSDPIWGGD